MTPRVQAALKKLLTGPQDHRDDALLELINEELKTKPIHEIEYVRDRVRFSCPPCPVVSSVVDMLNGLLDLKRLRLG